MEIQINVNGDVRTVHADGAMPLLWVLRDLLGMTGTKYGCGVGMCGACTIHLEGQAVRSCQVPVSTLRNRKIVTIEGLGKSGTHSLQAAWIELQVPQCGYCQSGQLMTATALLAKNPSPDTQTIDAAMRGNLCRCGTYDRIRKGIQQVIENKGTR